MDDHSKCIISNNAMTSADGCPHSVVLFSWIGTPFVYICECKTNVINEGLAIQVFLFHQFYHGTIIILMNQRTSLRFLSITCFVYIPLLKKIRLILALKNSTVTLAGMMTLVIIKYRMIMNR